MYFLGPEAIPYFAASAGIINIIGVISDLKTTENALALGATEMNPTIAPNPNKNEFYGTKQKNFESIFLTIGMIFPPIGVAEGIDRMNLAIQNFKKTKEFLKQGK